MKKLILPIALVALLSSCSNVDDDNQIIVDPIVTEKPYENGILMTNEGNLGSSNGEISFIKNDFSFNTNKIFALSNANASLGDVAQFIGFNNDLAFIVVNNSNTIEIVNRYTFSKITQINTNLNQPRALAFSNGKIYVTNANDKTVSVYNGTSYAFIKSVSLDFQPEKVVATNGYVYVQTSEYSEGNAVEIIDTTSDTNTLDLSFSAPMNGITLDASSNAVYVISSDENKTEISKIEDTSVTKNITSNTIKESKKLTFDNDNLYFTSGIGIFTISKNLENFPSTSLFNVADNTWSTLYAFNVIDGKVYTSDAKGFVDNSEITIYNLSGSVLKIFTTEIGTNDFYKN